MSFYLKSLAAAGELKPELIDRYASKTGVVESLERFRSILGAENGYVPGIDPDPLSYLREEGYLGPQAGLAESVAYLQALSGSPWDDEYFTPAQPTAEQAAQGYALSRESLVTYWIGAEDRGAALAVLQGLEGPLQDHVSSLQENHLRQTSETGVDGLYAAAWDDVHTREHFRGFLKGEGFLLENGSTWESNERDYEQPVRENELAADLSGSLVSAEQDVLNWQLESYNNLLSENSFLASALLAYEQEDGDAAFTAARERFFAGYSDLEEPAPQPFTVGVEVSGAWREAASQLQSARNEIAHLRETLTSYGKVVSDFLDNVPFDDISRPIRSEIADIRSRIADTEAQWERLINGPGGFRALELDYAEQYGEVRARLSELGEAKQEHKTAKAIHEYASSGYLANAVPASQSVTSPEDLQAEMEALQESIDAVDPDARLLYVHDRLRNASAAVDALQAIFEDPDTQQTLLQRDAAYAEYRRSYEEYYRSEMVLHKIEKVLSSEGQEQTVAVRDARSAYEEALQEFAGLSLEGERQTFVDDLLQKIQDPSDTNDRFTNLISRIAIQYDEAGNASIGFSAAGDVEARRGDFERYFGAAGLPFEEVAYLQEVLRFSEKLDANAITLNTIQQWVKAMAFEELQIRTGGEPEYIVETGDGRDSSYNWIHFNPAVQSAMEEILKGAYVHTDDKVQQYVDEHYVYQELQASYNATNRNDKDYKLFQMACLLGLWGGKPSTLGNDYLEYVTFYSSANELDDKLDSFWTWFYRDDWRDRRNRARYARDICESSVTDTWDLLDSGGGDPNAKLALLEQAEARLSLLNGDASGAPVGIANLKQAILDAFQRDPYEHLDQVLALTSIQGPDIGSKLDRLLNPLRIAGKTFAGTAKDTLLLLQAVMEETARQKESIQNRIQVYLAASSSSEDPGIAVVQEERLREYGELLARFLRDGAVAPEGSELKAHESLVAHFGDAKVGDVQVLAAVGAYLADYYRDVAPASAVGPVPSGYSTNRFERDLHEAYQAFFLEPLNEDLRRRRWEVLTERYVAMVHAYRLGADFLYAAEAALNNPVFSSREHALRGFEDIAAVFDSLTKTYDGYTFAGAGLAVGDMQEGLEEVLAGRSRAYRELRVQEMSLLRTELEEQRLLWDQQMSAILARGQMEWKQAQHQVQARQQQWQKSFQESFQVKKEAWNLQYAIFLEQKREWVAGLTEQATRVGNQRILERFGADTRETIARGQDFLISDVAELPDPDALIAQTLGEGLLSALLGGAGNLRNGIAQWEPVSFGALKLASFQGAESLERIRAFQCRQNEQLSTRMAVLQYGQALEALREARQGLEGQVADANQEFSESMRRMLLHDGFRQEGVNFVKQAVVGATLWRTLTETHTIGGYQDYEAQLKEVGQLLPEADAGSLEQLGFAGIQGLLSRGLRGLEEEQERVFGEPEDTRYLHQRYGGEGVAGQEDDAALGYAAQLAVYERVRGVDTQRIGEEEFERLVEELEGSEGERVVVMGGGEFGAHIGFAPTLKPEPDADYALEEYEKNQRFAGLGEQGRILGLYLQHKLIEAKGYAEANQPFYNKKLWDDRDADFKAFTLRSVVDIGVTIAAAVFAPVTGGASLAASVALNLVDDAVFTLADIASGLDAGEAFGAFGKKALTSAATAAIGVGFNGFSGAQASFHGLAGATGKFGDSVIGSTLLKGAEVATTNSRYQRDQRHRFHADRQRRLV